MNRVLVAIAVSGVVHAGAAIVGWSTPAAPIAGAVGAAPLRATIASADTPARVDARSPDTRADTNAPMALEPIPVAGKPRVVAARQAPAPRAAEKTDEPSNEPVSESIEVASPTPVTYPVFTLPPNDDPRRIGLTRLLLIVSSQGTTMDVVVTASTMSQDDVDSLVKTFAAMRFEPARVRGLPYPGTYEVVVNFEYEPPRQAAL